MVHFDLKCDNVLLAPLPGRKATDMWHTDPAAIDPAFRVVLADFGEGRAFGQLRCAAVRLNTPSHLHTDQLTSQQVLMLARSPLQGKLLPALFLGVGCHPAEP